MECNNARPLNRSEQLMFSHKDAQGKEGGRLYRRQGRQRRQPNELVSERFVESIGAKSFTEARKRQEGGRPVFMLSGFQINRRAAKKGDGFLQEAARGN